MGTTNRNVIALTRTLSKRAAVLNEVLTRVSGDVGKAPTVCSKQLIEFRKATMEGCWFKSRNVSRSF